MSVECVCNLRRCAFDLNMFLPTENGDIVHTRQSADEKSYDLADGVAESMEVVMDERVSKSDASMD